MHTMRITRPLALAGFAPAGKPGNANQARRRVAAAILCVSASWLAYALAALGIATAQAQTPTETVLHTFGSVPKGRFHMRA